VIIWSTAIGQHRISAISPECAIKQTGSMFADLHRSHTPCLVSIAYYLSRNTTMFPSFVLLSGIALFSSAVAAVTHDINVGNGLKFDPPYIVKPQISHHVEG
jgi:hypothetical protein